MNDIQTHIVSNISWKLFIRSDNDPITIINETIYSEIPRPNAFRPIWEQMWADYGGSIILSDQAYRSVGSDLPGTPLFPKNTTTSLYSNKMNP